MRAGQLVKNYRSHATLLHLPNALFYNETLQAAADQREVLPPQWAAQQLERGREDAAGLDGASWEASNGAEANGGEQALG